MDVLSQVGPRLRVARRISGWTLEELAEHVGVSASTLSRLETGERRADLELLVPVTRALGIGIDELLGERTTDPRARRPIVRRDGITFIPLAPEGSPLRAFKVTHPAGNVCPEPLIHEGYEWLYVLAGRLRLVLGGRELVLRRGESAEFDTGIPHAMCAYGGKPCEIISIFDADGARTQTHIDGGLA